MGTEAAHYVMFGINVPYDVVRDRANLEQYEDNAYVPEVTAVSGLTLVSDGMNGRYAVFGEVIEKAIDEGLDLIEIDMDRPDMDRLGTVEFGKKLASILGISNWTEPAKIIIFTHWH